MNHIMDELEEKVFQLKICRNCVSWTFHKEEITIRNYPGESSERHLFKGYCAIKEKRTGSWDTACKEFEGRK